MREDNDTYNVRTCTHILIGCCIVSKVFIGKLSATGGGGGGGGVRVCERERELFVHKTCPQVR